MNEMTMSEILTMFDNVCVALAKKVSVNEISSESLTNICHGTSITLIETIAEETNREPEIIYQTIKSFLERENTNYRFPIQ